MRQLCCLVKGEWLDYFCPKCPYHNKLFCGEHALGDKSFKRCPACHRIMYSSTTILNRKYLSCEGNDCEHCEFNVPKCLRKWRNETKKTSKETKG